MFRSTTKGPPGETKLGPQILNLVARLTRFWRPDIVARTGERAAGCGLAGGWTGRPGLCYRDRGRWHTDKRILRRHTHANIRQTHLIQPHGLKLQKNRHKKQALLRTGKIGGGGAFWGSEERQHKAEEHNEEDKKHINIKKTTF